MTDRATLVCTPIFLGLQTFIARVNIKIFINKLLIIPGKEVAILSGRHHRFVFYLHIWNIDESGFILLKIEMNIHKIFSVLFRLWDNKFKCLFIPSFANPTNVFKFCWLWGNSLSPKNYVITIYIFLHYRMQGSDLLIL